MANESGIYILAELAKIRGDIQANWTDSYGRQCVSWIERAEKKLKEIDARREARLQEEEMIREICKKNIENPTGDNPKMLKR